MTTGKTDLPEDRTELGDLWATVMAEIDVLEEALSAARRREAVIWRALERSRRKTVRSEDDKETT